MKIRRKTLLNILLIGFVLSFFVTPLGNYSKVWLMQLFAFAPNPIEERERERIPSYDWRLKDANWEFFNFREARGQVALINLWASWRLPCLPELRGIQSLYEDYGDRVRFYIITDEEREPVEAFMQEHGFTFPVTYRVVGDPAPVDLSDPPRSYLIDKKGFIVAAEEGISDWDSARVRELLDQLLQQPYP
ncbi:TlpA disulfide reductase family protein [Robiginitalea sp. SC105]|uniref:TlpA family protein disulfide reductase n=1 Tax=Robiginitalea sp. SC105 TaxID=2762332 RepID=UPI00163B120E|nr:TlpA disulfide reductase family protein [Robiginitalea sp. SC105]MBC2840031.1 TlpA family protein disulfide reductase [Robiginitalea sp. SC105]